MVCQRNPGWRVAKAVLNSSCAARHVLSAADSQIRVGISCQPSFLCCWFFCCSGLYRRGLTAGLGDTTQVAAWVWWLSLCWFCFWRGGFSRRQFRVIGFSFRWRVRGGKPRLTAEPTVVVPPQGHIADNHIPNLGTMAAVLPAAPPSNGTGSGGGIGSGSGWWGGRRSWRRRRPGKRRWHRWWCF